MIDKKITDDMLSELYSTLASLQTADDVKTLFEDLCTYKEIV